eukprot:1584365-Prymnesium_polylepis.1
MLHVSSTPHNPEGLWPIIPDYSREIRWVTRDYIIRMMTPKSRMNTLEPRCERPQPGPLHMRATGITLCSGATVCGSMHTPYRPQGRRMAPEPLHIPRGCMT